MVIVCTEKKFIFIKPFFVNGKCIEKNLQPYCKNKKDIIATLFNYNNNCSNQRNVEILNMSNNCYPWYCYVHLPLSILFPKINKFYKDNITSKYKKISILKNPFVSLIDFFILHTDEYFDNEGKKIKHTKIKPGKSDIKNPPWFWKLYGGSFKITHYWEELENQDNWEKIKNMFNKWIMSGIIYDYQVNNWETLNEHYYYNNREEKKNEIDFFIRFENMNDDIKLLCKEINIPVFQVKEENIIRKKNIFNNKKLKDFYNPDTIEYVNNTFNFTIDIGNYKYNEDQIYY